MEKLVRLTRRGRYYFIVMEAGTFDSEQGFGAICETLGR